MGIEYLGDFHSRMQGISKTLLYLQDTIKNFNRLNKKFMLQYLDFLLMHREELIDKGEKEFVITKEKKIITMEEYKKRYKNGKM